MWLTPRHAEDSEERADEWTKKLLGGSLRFLARSCASPSLRTSGSPGVLVDEGMDFVEGEESE